MYLRQFKKLRLVNLAGNPIAASPDYRSYVLSHIKDLTYLDYRRVNAADVAAAIEQHQVSFQKALSKILLHVQHSRMYSMAAHHMVCRSLLELCSVRLLRLLGSSCNIPLEYGSRAE